MLAIACVWCSLSSATLGQQSPPEKLATTAEQARAGLKALMTSWKTREIHFVIPSKNEHEAGVAAPNRLAGWVRQAREGYFLYDVLSYKDNVAQARYYSGYDGTQYRSTEFSPALSQKPQWDHSRPQPTPTSRVYYPAAFDIHIWQQRGKDYTLLDALELADDVQASAVDESMVAVGAKWILENDTFWVYADLDTQKDYWPVNVRLRKRSAKANGAPKKEERAADEVSITLEYSDFRKVKGYWFPFRAKQKITSVGGKSEDPGQLAIVTGVNFDIPLDPSSFQPVIPRVSLGKSQ